MLKLQNKSLSDKLTSAQLKAEKLDEVEKENLIKTENLKQMDEENKSLREQLKKFANCDMRDEESAKNVNALMEENLEKLARITSLEDEVSSLKEEKESLISTLKLMQDELNLSERRRRKDSQSS